MGKIEKMWPVFSQNKSFCLKSAQLPHYKDVETIPHVILWKQNNHIYDN